MELKQGRGGRQLELPPWGFSSASVGGLPALSCSGLLLSVDRPFCSPGLSSKGFSTTGQIPTSHKQSRPVSLPHGALSAVSRSGHRFTQTRAVPMGPWPLALGVCSLSQDRVFPFLSLFLDGWGMVTLKLTRA